MSLSFNQAMAQAKNFLEKAVSAAAEMLITPNKSPEEIVREAQRIYDLVIKNITDAQKGSKNSALQHSQQSQAVQPQASYKDSIELLRKIKKEYKVNELRAKKKYNGQIMTFTGVFAGFDDDNYDDDSDEIEIYLGLGRKKYPDRYDEYEKYEDAIKCRFNRMRYEDRLADVDVGTKLTVTGKFNRAGAIYWVYLKDCSFVS